MCLHFLSSPICVDFEEFVFGIFQIMTDLSCPMCWTYYKYATDRVQG